MCIMYIIYRIINQIIHLVCVLVWLGVGGYKCTCKCERVYGCVCMRVVQ